MSFDQEISQKQSGTKTAFTNQSIKPILENFDFLSIAITWLKIIRILQVGGVLESSGPPLDDGHRDFQNWCILGWEIDENESAVLIDANCNLLYRTLNLWRSYEGWDLSSSIKGLFYYQHVDCGYYCVACRCIVCGHCSSHQPTDQRRQDCRLQERSPCCRAAVSVTWLLQPPAVHYEVFT